MTTKDRFNYLTFSDWNAMYHFITSEGDLYNPFLNKYAFTYNNDGAICVYDVTPAEAVELVEQSVENHELWSASLGTEGQILDNDSLDRNDEQYLAVSYEFCKENYNKVGWMRTDDFFQDSYTRKFIKYQATDAQKKYLGQAIKIHDYCEMSILFDYTDDVHYDLLTSALAEIAETDEKFMTRLENALSVESYIALKNVIPDNEILRNYMEDGIEHMQSILSEN